MLHVASYSKSGELQKVCPYIYDSIFNNVKEIQDIVNATEPIEEYLNFLELQGWDMYAISKHAMDIEKWINTEELISLNGVKWEYEP